MKKIIALVVALVMMAAMAVPAFAAEKVTGSDALESEFDLQGGTTITYGAQQAYTITIPQGIDFKPENADKETGLITVESAISVSEYSLAADKTLYVSVNPDDVLKYQTANQAAGWFLYETGAELTGANDVQYYITVKGDGAEKADRSIARGDSVISACTGVTIATITETLVFTTYGTSQVASFTDTVSYTVTIE